jgi:hypothetical protein
MQPDTKRDIGMDEAEDAAATPPGNLTKSQERGLKIAIVVMGLMIVVGFLAIVARVVYLAGSRGEQGPAVAREISPRAMEPGGEATLLIPAGAIVRHVTLSGDRLAVHWDGPAGAVITVVDIRDGRVLSRIVLAPEAPR